MDFMLDRFIEFKLLLLLLINKLEVDFNVLMVVFVCIYK